MQMGLNQRRQTEKYKHFAKHHNEIEESVIIASGQCLITKTVHKYGTGIGYMKQVLI
jgi:hypothetical protein